MMLYLHLGGYGFACISSLFLLFNRGHGVPANLQIICDGELATVACPAGTYIEVTDATYGRQDKTTCPYISTSMTGCISSTTLSVTRSMCNGRQRCQFGAKPHFAIYFGDPCPGTYKYLRIVYVCKPMSYIALSCQDAELTIECPSEFYIDVTDVIYGRQYVVPCLEDRFTGVTCISPNAYAKTQSMCNGKTRCEFNADPSLSSYFKDPCPELYKYLRVEYTCNPDDMRNRTASVLVESPNPTIRSASDVNTVNGASSEFQAISWSTEATIAVCVVGGVFLFIIAGLIVYIAVMKRKQNSRETKRAQNVPQTTAPRTEIHEYETMR